MAKFLTHFTWVLPFVGFLMGYAGPFFFKQKSSLLVPQLIGKRLHEALILVAQQELSIKLLGEKEDASLPEGTILNQVPEAQEKIRPQQSIFVTITKKPRVLQAPSFLAKPYSEVKKIATEKQIKLQRRWIASPYPLKQCVAQVPQPGKTITAKKMTVFFSSGNMSWYIVPNFKNLQVSNVEEYCKKMNILTEVFLTRPGISGQIIDQKPIAGSIVDLSKQLLVQLQVAE